MTACSTAFSLSNMNPFATPQSLGDLRACLVRSGINLTDDGRAWPDPAGKPTCWDCWADNILSDKVSCATHCLRKFLDPGNSGDFDTDACLQCDEYVSGAQVIACAAANRRALGISSDIDRGHGQICGRGLCSSGTCAWPKV